MDLFGEMVLLLAPVHGEASVRKRRPEPKSAAVREAETALYRALENVLRGIVRLQNEVRESASFLESLLGSVSTQREQALIQGRLNRMRKDWPELLDKRKGD